MVGSVKQRRLDVDNRITGYQTVVQCSLQTFLSRLDVFARNRSADNRVDEFEALAFFIRFKANPDMTILTTAA